MISVLFFEPLLWNDIVDYPDLGAACLQGVLKRQNIASKLICTQLEYLKHLFLDYATVIENLFCSLSQDEKERYPTLYELESSFREHFANLYQRYYSHKWTDYLDAELTSFFKRVFLESNSLQLKGILNGEETPILLFFKKVILTNPTDIICLSCYELSQLNQVLLKNIRNITKSRIILGGAFTSHLTDLEIRALIELNCVDYIVIGPGDRALPELLKYLDGEVIHLPLNVVDTSKHFSDCVLVKKPLSNLDELPYPDFSQSQIEKYPCPITILPLQTARGCTYRKCTFCSHHSSYYGEYHVFSIEKMVEMIIYLSNQNQCNHFVFHDDEIPYTRLKKISFKTNQILPKIRFSAYVRADSSFTGNNIFKELYSYGVRCLNWGIESGSQNMLDYIKKGINIVSASTILKESYEAGISNTCWMMINIPSETDKDFNATLRFMLENTKFVHLWMVSPFRLQYDSPLYIELEKGGEKIPFSTSVKPTQKALEKERKKSSRIDVLSSLGLLSNKRLLDEILPSGCQRARLLPFVYLSSIVPGNELTLTDSFQIVLLKSRIITIGKQYYLVKGKKRVHLSQKDVELIKRGVYHNLNPKKLKNTQICLLKSLIESEYLHVIKASTLWDMQ